MRKYILIAVILLSLSSTAFSQAKGKVMEGKLMKSRILGKDVKYSVYLPHDYYTSERNYPVVYLLHGYSDNETAWVQFGNIHQTADKAIADGDITEMIIVMPDGGVTFYINDYQGKTRWMDMFIKEFIPHIDAGFKTRPTREFRAISGLSMGGYGSMINILKNPGMFSTAAPLSAAIWSDEQMAGMDAGRYSISYQSIFGARDSSGLPRHYYSHSVFNLIKKMSPDTLKTLRFYIDCGDEDFLAIGNSWLHIAMREKNIAHEFRVRDGAHNWKYWREGILDALKFISAGFDRR